eukprot:765774-Hanusia_phi.AAC.4
MFTVRSKRRKGKDGKLWEHQVKALEIIWQKFPEYYSARNTVHVDDLSRNFALNPNQGLKISRFVKTSADPSDDDMELQVLQRLAKFRSQSMKTGAGIRSACCQDRYSCSCLFSKMNPSPSASRSLDTAAAASDAAIAR